MKVRIKTDIDGCNLWYKYFKGSSFEVEQGKGVFRLKDRLLEKEIADKYLCSQNPLCIYIEPMDCDIIAESSSINEKQDVKIRRFPTGAIRSDNTGRERFDWISPLALKALAEYLATTENSFAQINYFKGITEEACVESLLRHINDFQINGHKKEAVALLFNAVALVHTICLKERGEYKEIYPTTELIYKSEYKEE